MNRLAEILFNKNFENCSAEEIQSLSEKYPFFSAGHLLALKKTKTENNEQFNQALQKASLHFAAPYLDSILKKNGAAVISKKEPEQDAYPVSATQLSQIESNTETPALIVSANGTEHPKTVEAEKPDAEMKVQEQITEPVNIEATTPVNETASSATPDKSSSPILFEPYHTVDYFASQGIKIKLEENPTDRFSKQLKSFTEWLKALKKIPAAEENTPVAPANIEEKVEQLAEVSLTDSNVETEAMAEVWAKQGNTGKAIEIYQKLSLLEPAKSPYFATRISELKKL